MLRKDNCNQYWTTLYRNKNVKLNFAILSERSASSTSDVTVISSNRQLSRCFPRASFFKETGWQLAGSTQSNIQFKVNKVKIQIPDVYQRWSWLACADRATGYPPLFTLSGARQANSPPQSLWKIMRAQHLESRLRCWIFVSKNVRNALSGLGSDYRNGLWWSSDDLQLLTRLEY